jgi:hypothetical protein
MTAVFTNCPLTAGKDNEAFEICRVRGGFLLWESSHSYYSYMVAALEGRS